MVPFPVTLSDPSPRFQGHGVILMPIDALSVFCAQLTRDLLAIAKFLLCFRQATGRSHNVSVVLFVHSFVCYQNCEDNILK